MWLSSFSGARNLPFDPFSLKQQQIYTNPDDWYLLLGNWIPYFAHIAGLQGKTTTRPWTGPGTGLTEKWRQKLMMIRRSCRTLSYLLFAPSNKLVWTDEGLRKFMFFSTVRAYYSLARHARNFKSMKWTRWRHDRACCHVAFNRSARQCFLLDSRKFKTYSRLDITFLCLGWFWF